MKALDLFQKSTADVQVHTVTGGIVTVATSLFICFLVLGEAATFFSTTTIESIGVDRSFGGRISVNVDLKFPNSACRFVNFDVVDSTGEEQIAVEDIKKIAVPNPSAKLKEGCHVVGELHINKIAGNFHFALGKGVPGTALGASMSTDPFAKTMVGAQHQHRFDMFELQMFNASHEIRQLSFGTEYPGMERQPLQGLKRYVPSGVGQYNYYLSVVPTTYTKLNGRVIRSYQYSYTEKVVEVKSTATRFPHPGCFFYLSISPLVVEIKEEQRSWLHFITNLCAIVGAVWVVSTFIDSLASWLVLRLCGGDRAASSKRLTNSRKLGVYNPTATSSSASTYSTPTGVAPLSMPPRPRASPTAASGVVGGRRPTPRPEPAAYVATASYEDTASVQSANSGTSYGSTEDVASFGPTSSPVSHQRHHVTPPDAGGAVELTPTSSSVSAGAAAPAAASVPSHLRAPPRRVKKHDRSE